MFLLLFACNGPEQTDVGLETELAPSPRLYRLTHTQWENSVADLFLLDEPSGYADGFIGDTLSEGFENDAEALEVGSTLFRDYQRAAEALASDLVEDAERYPLVVEEDARSSATGVEFEESVLGSEGTATEGAAEGDTWDLWSNGTWTADIELPATGDYVVGALVYGSDCGDEVFATMDLSVDGEALVSAYETSASATWVEVELELSAGTHEVEVAFLNDCWEPAAGYDRNLWIEQVSVRGEYSALGESAATLDDAEDWIRRFGQKVFRRSLSEDEVDAYVALFEQGPALVASGDDFADGVELVLSALLQSPHFLYRVEASRGLGARIPLSDFEVAAKLSFALWATTPDDDLLVLAERGELHTPGQVRAEARRMLEDERAAEVLADFHAQLFDLDDYANIYKADERWDEGLNEDLREEMERFIAYTVVDSDGGLRDLLTSRTAFLSADLAELYGVDAADWSQVELDPAERSGFLTRAGFLASEAGSKHPSPIHRGVFLNRKVLCTSLPPPPDDVTALPALEEGTTNRERVEAHTGAGTCGEGCHSSLINPLGYAFEGYDALGVTRTEDNGQPVDTTSSFTFVHGVEEFSGAIELSDVLAESSEAHRCYAEHQLSFTLARAPGDDDEARISELGEQSFDADLSVSDLVVELVSSEDFLCRSQQPEFR